MFELVRPTISGTISWRHQLGSTWCRMQAHVRPQTLNVVDPDFLETLNVVDPDFDFTTFPRLRLYG